VIIEIVGGDDRKKICKKFYGPVRDLNPGPLAPEAKIIPLDQQAVLLLELKLSLLDWND
jgi:hypothetical protein